MAAVETDTIEKKTDEETGIKTVNSFEMIKPLGKGAFGKVKLCKDTRDGKLYALKIMDKTVLKKKRQGMSNMLQSVQREIAIMKKLNHENCVKMYEVLDCPTNPKLYIRIEYVDGGQSMPTGNDVPPLELDTARSYFKDLMRGLEYLHFNNVIHRDIKPENLLITGTGMLKIADFGVSQVLETDDDLISKSAGTPAFMAPEMCRAGAFHGKLGDLWACGCSLYMFAYGRVPFVNPSVFELYEDIQNKEIVYDEKIPADLIDLLKLMLNKDVDERLKVTFAVINAHPWVTAGGGAPAINPGMTRKVSINDVEIAQAITTTRHIVLMVKIHQVMRKHLDSARSIIQERRNSAMDMTAGLQALDVKDLGHAPPSPAQLPTPPNTPSEGSDASKPILPPGYTVAEDSDEDETPTGASRGSVSSEEGLTSPSGKKKKSTKCTQQ
eukprot:CAMPEP_0206255336 /NCGR_PEP_ID=MMETSP0047_2-20121206/24190_1 /ASSEMBLY_ACC=CAM_ASM_000192 /TAXON_ID=195065 /ORGANISM="Chroomonas mesostigmatica_cf, Strain CCMP1168" /LENGTH=438 /DNA_ID=CAMNT_0053681723 /DNA_START=118 /DNA_END=1434 /DNA_ORIENTATION=+